MRHLLIRAWAALALLVAAAPAFAVSPISIVVGPSRDGSLQDLQKKVDHLLGFGALNVRTDFIGAHPGDPDPFFWFNPGGRGVAVTLIDRKSPHGVLGWYQETGTTPVIDGLGDGVVFDDQRMRGTRALVRLPASVARFGFYVSRRGGDRDEEDGGSYLYFTNRLFNDRGLHGRGAEHAPWDGDVQMLIYDVSRFLGPNTWLVACEYSDSGAPIGMGRGESDNDYSDILYTVTALGATTPAGTTSFSRVKALWR